MMENLQIFENEQFGNIRVVEKDGAPWFVGKDIADILGYEKPTDAVRKHCDDEDRGISKMETPSGKQNMTIINESGLYSLILSSKLPQARQFKRWVTSEVLPAIRETGTYEMPKQEKQPASPMELLKLEFEALKEVDGKIEAVNDDLQKFKKSMPLLGVEESRITCAVQKKGVKCLGGKDSAAYQDLSVRGRVYADIYRQLKREFGVNSYKAIQREKCDYAVGIVEGYKLPHVLAEKIKSLNLQMSMGGDAK